jgi:hypothetical protein
MGAAEPMPVELVDIGLGTAVLILGIFLIIVGITIAGVVYRESREWKKLVLPMFDMKPEETPSASSEESGSSKPRVAVFGREVCSRLFNHMDVAGLLGGAGIVIVGILVVIIGLNIGR